MKLQGKHLAFLTALLMTALVGLPPSCAHAYVPNPVRGLLAITEVTGASTNIFLPVCDHIGTIHALIAAMTNSVALPEPIIVETRTYSPYGELIEVDRPLLTANCKLPTVHCPFGFQSKYYDPETGFWYYGYRYYDAKSCKWLTADPLQEAGGLNLTAFCGGDPVSQIDPLGLETFIAVDDIQKLITLNMMLRYVPAKGVTFKKGELAKLASQHEKWAEELFGNYTYGGENAPHVKRMVQHLYGLRGSERLYKEFERDLGPKYKGYIVRLNVITTTEPEPADAFWTDPYETIDIHREEIWENIGNLSAASFKLTVFHEYMHQLNLWDEYDPAAANRQRKFQVKNWREEFKKSWGRYPEDNAIMTCGGAALYDRYIEAALFDIDNIWRDVRDGLDRTFYLDPNEEFFTRGRRKAPNLCDKVHAIIEANQ